MSQHHRRLHVGGRRWMHRRYQVLSRAGFICQVCKVGRGMLQVDHIDPLASQGSAYSMENLQAICSSCHKAKHAAPNPVKGQAEWLKHLNLLRSDSSMMEAR